MFREMRRRKQELEREELLELLNAGDHGILTVHGEDGYPYPVPINYVFLENGIDGTAEQGAFYFHCSREGHKMDAVKQDPKASFCVVGQHEVVAEKFATRYKSVVAFGQVNIVDEPTMRDALYKLSKKFDPAAHESILRVIEEDLPGCAVLELVVDHMTGKRSIKGI